MEMIEINNRIFTLFLINPLLTRKENFITTLFPMYKNFFLCYNAIMNKVSMKAYAKINLTLDIVEREESGMHLIDTVMQTIDLHDIVTVKKRKDKQVFCKTVKGREIENSNAEKAANLFVETFDTNGVDIEIIRRIPIGAGLGGSSADAVAVLKAMALLYCIPFNQLVPLAEQLGSDTIFLLNGGLARCTGYGNVVEKLPPLDCLYVLVAVPEGEISTKDAYERYDVLKKQPPRVRTDEILEKLRVPRDVKMYTTNALTPASIALMSQVNDKIKALQDKDNLMVGMTGSGCAVFGLYKDLDAALNKMYELDFPTDVYAFVN